MFSVEYHDNNTTTELFQIIRGRIMEGAPNMRLVNLRNRGEIHNERRYFWDLDIINGDKIMVVNIGVGLDTGFPYAKGPIGDIPTLANVPAELRDVFEAQRTEAVARGTYNLSLIHI